MLEKVNLKKEMTKSEYKQHAEPLKKELTVLQQQIKTAKLPVIILFEGWGAAGKGSLITSLILNFDPRGFKVYSLGTSTETEKRMPPMWRFWKTIPENGNLSILDRSWYQDISIAKFYSEIDGKELAQRTKSILTFERQLIDNGYLIIKFFLHISQKEQKARFDKLDESKNTEWRVTEDDRKRNREYDRMYEIWDDMLEKTDTPIAPWHLVSGHDKYAARISIFHTVVTTIKAALAQKEKPEPIPVQNKIRISPEFHLVPMPDVSKIPLTKTITDEKYDKTLDKLQNRLSELHYKLYRKRVPVIIGYEGWDAAGKGGNIKRVAAALDPRGYEVIPIAAPDKTELNHHYLWRFWNHMPKTGHIAIFDRTWYGRVLVERIEGFCTPSDWHRAYQEINEFEQGLTDWGAVVVKFWLQIDKDEQLKRFTARQETPEKQWKITDEDWRNREKWPQYEEAVNDMIRYTSTDFAPWHIIESQDKKYGRIQALEILISAIEERLS